MVLTKEEEGWVLGPRQGRGKARSWDQDREEGSLGPSTGPPRSPL